MSEMFEKFHPGEFIALIAVIVGPLVAITACATPWSDPVPVDPLPSWISMGCIPL